MHFVIAFAILRWWWWCTHSPANSVWWAILRGRERVLFQLQCENMNIIIDIRYTPDTPDSFIDTLCGAGSTERERERVDGSEPTHKLQFVRMQHQKKNISTNDDNAEQWTTIVSTIILLSTFFMCRFYFVFNVLFFHILNSVFVRIYSINY